MVKGRMLRGPGVHRWWIWVGRKRGLAFARVCDLGGTLRTGHMTAARVGLDWRGDLVVAVFEEKEGANGAACLRSDRSAGFRDGSKKKKKKGFGWAYGLIWRWHSSPFRNPKRNDVSPAIAEAVGRRDQGGRPKNAGPVAIASGMLAAMNDLGHDTSAAGHPEKIARECVEETTFSRYSDGDLETGPCCDEVVQAGHATPRGKTPKPQFWC
jgi:hypothetical protein